MACCQPFFIKNPNFLRNGDIHKYQKYLQVPCGWCLNCRVDRQNWLSDAMTYEQKNLIIFALLLLLLTMIFIFMTLLILLLMICIGTI